MTLCAKKELGQRQTVYFYYTTGVMTKSLWPLLVHRTVLHKPKLACYLTQNGWHLKTGCFPLIGWKMALLWIFNVTRVGSQRAGAMPHQHACQIHAGIYQNQRVELIGVEERMVTGSPCDRSRCWTLDPSHGYLAAGSLSTQLPCLLGSAWRR